MSILPSPPLPLSPDLSHSRYRSQPPPDETMKSLVASSWRVMDQPPPPTLREILEAYKARGDGDREMLLAMLNAKSAEDQRLASLATLHRTMLDMYQVPHAQTVPSIPPLHVPDSHHSQSYSHSHSHNFPSPPASYHHSPRAPVSQQLHQDAGYYSHRRTTSSSSPADPGRDRMIASSSSSQQTRKRRRTSRSPPPTREAMSAHPNDLPPSPYSSASSAQSSGDSPRSRESMAINSLLLNAHSGTAEDDTPKRNTSSERSTMPRER
ncbi:hypothetical protein C8Q80DRAFT_1116492 [Daedaleopsis nitida]|nr:hypothetical protein C8Q80DRAFT_1116492 [Daedaleopsis nitida]